MGKIRRSGCDEDSLQRFLADLTLAAQDGELLAVHAKQRQGAFAAGLEQLRVCPLMLDRGTISRGPC